MTKYILHGGNSRDINTDNDSFFREMTLGSIGKTLVLLNYFSRKDNEVEECAEQDKKRFLQNSDNKQLDFEIADQDKLADQLQRASIVWMRGGETAKLLEGLRKTSEIEHLFDGKVIGDSSAGVYVLAKYYWENDNDKIGDGLGIFNIKAFCHCTPEDTIIVNKLLAYKEPLPLFTLPNYKWTVWYK